MANSWRVGIKTSGDVDWCYNALAFATRDEAEAYGRDLASRWTAVVAWEVHPAVGVTARWEDGHLVHLRDQAEGS